MTQAAIHDIASCQWDKPIPLGRESDLPNFPTAVLPTWLRNYVESEASATQTPADLAGSIGLSVCAACIARKIEVQARKSWKEPINIYTVTALESGERKSAVFADMTKPLAMYEARQAQEMRDEIAKEKGKHEILEKLKKKAQDAVVEVEGEQRTRALAEAAQAAIDLERHHVPSTPRLIVDDCTPERVGSMLCEQGGRIAAMSPEGDLFDLMTGRYQIKGKPNFGVFLKGHTGDSLRVDRQGGRSQSIDKPAITVGMAVQPAVLRALAEKEIVRGQGLLARFLYSLPKSIVGSRTIASPPVPVEVRTKYAARIVEMLEIEPDSEIDGRQIPHIVRLSKDADEALQTFEAWLEPQLSQFGKLRYIADWSGKLAGAVVRFAGILHVADCIGIKREWKNPVPVETVDRAIELGKYYLEHARAAFEDMQADSNVRRASHILQWIRQGNIEQFSARDAFTETRCSMYLNMKAFNTGLQRLEQNYYVRKLPMPSQTGKGRKQSQLYRVNPHAHKEGS